MARPKNRAKSPATRTQNAAQQRATVSLSHSQSYEGPIPPPSLLEQYNNVIPDGAERILRMAESQSVHRMSLERLVIESDVSRAKWGLIGGVLVALAFGACSLVLGVTGHDIPSAAVGGLTIASIVGVFIYGTERRRTERIEKAKIMTGQE